MATFKCRNCRIELFNSDIVISHHGYQAKVVDSDPNGFNFDLRSDHSDECEMQSSIWYLQEDQLPQWMKDQLIKGEWVKGKLCCPNDKCPARIGSFDFVHSDKCKCGNTILPAVHVVKSKVDCQINKSVK